MEESTTRSGPNETVVGDNDNTIQKNELPRELVEQNSFLLLMVVVVVVVVVWSWPTRYSQRTKKGTNEGTHEQRSNAKCCSPPQNVPPLSARGIVVEFKPVGSHWTHRPSNGEPHTHTVSLSSKANTQIALVVTHFFYKPLLLLLSPLLLCVDG